jgi:hypothetical protein
VDGHVYSFGQNIENYLKREPFNKHKNKFVIAFPKDQVSNKLIIYLIVPRLLAIGPVISSDFLGT